MGAAGRYRVTAVPKLPLDNQRPAQLRLTSIFTMAKLIVAVLLSLLLARVLAGGFYLDNTGCPLTSTSGDDCRVPDSICKDINGTPTCKCKDGFEPNAANDACKKSVGESCTQSVECITNACDTTCKYGVGDTGCTNDASCVNGSACTTVSGTKKCTTLIDGTCSGTGQSTCPAFAACTCSCNSGYTANTAKSMCAQNGAVGVTVSLVLMAAAFVTSRFF